LLGHLENRVGQVASDRRSRLAVGLRRGGFFLAVVLPLLAVSVPAATQGNRWVLAETIVNPENAPVEFVVGTTPAYYESPRFDGTFQYLTVSPTVLADRLRFVDHGYQWYDVTISFSVEPPPPVLVPGERVTLRASGTGSGTFDTGQNPYEQFQFWGEGVTLEGEAYMAVGVNSAIGRTSGSVAPTFVVPEPSAEDAEIRIYSGLWNCAACSVVWVYRPEMAPPYSTTTAPQGPISHDITVVDGVIHLVSPPGGTLVISRQDLPEWARDALATTGDAYARVGPPGLLSQGDPNVLLDGLPVVRVGDSTTTGGIVTQGTPLILVNGVPAALVGGFVSDPVVHGLVPAVGGPILGRGNPCGATRTDGWGKVVCETTYPYPNGLLAEEARRGATRIQLGAGQSQFRVGDAVVIGDYDANVEVARVAAEGSLILDRPLANDHSAGALVVRIPDEYAHLVDPTGAVPSEPGIGLPADEGNGAWVIILAAMGGVAAIVFWQRRRAPADPPPPPPPPGMGE
jgi:uncharacterized Zn-binding protein involved in type VI secretion